MSRYFANPKIDVIISLMAVGKSYKLSYLDTSVDIAYIDSVNVLYLYNSAILPMLSTISLVVISREILRIPAKSNKRITASASSSSTVSLIHRLKTLINFSSAVSHPWHSVISLYSYFPLSNHFPFLSACTASISSLITRQRKCSLLNSLSWNPWSQAIL